MPNGQETVCRWLLAARILLPKIRLPKAGLSSPPGSLKAMMIRGSPCWVELPFCKIVEAANEQGKSRLPAEKTDKFPDRQLHCPACRYGEFFNGDLDGLELPYVAIVQRSG